MKILTYLSAAAVTLSGFAASAADMPSVEHPVPGSSIIIQQLSDNGKWAVSETGSVTDGDLRPIGGVIYNMENYEQTPISHSSGLSGVADISNDGSVVVGEFNGIPGYWTKEKGWQTVDLEPGMDLGRFNAVTPDGRYAVGYYTSSQDQFKASPMMYDLSTGKRISLPNLPVLDMTHLDQKMNVFYGVSPDGRYLLGEMSQSYVYPPSLCCYVYDRETATYDMIGFTESETTDWTPDVQDLYFVDAPVMSNNGEWVTGRAYMVHPIPGSEWANEGYTPFRYNVKNKEFELYGEASDADIAGFSIGNDGTVYGATPAENPYATAVVRSGKYFITLDQIFSQVYHYDFNALTGYSNTGKPLAVSDDGMTLIMLPNTEATYVLRLPEPLTEAAKRVKLLGNYSATPAAGVKISRLSTITLTFDRTLALRGDGAGITLTSADGSESYAPVAQNGVVVDGKKLIITFRSRNLNDGVGYTLTVPAGTVQIDGDADQVNEEIKVEYTGRANVPVKMEKAVPADDSYVSVLDASTNPIVLTFDAELKLADGAQGYLYLNEDTTPYCLMNLSVGSNMALVFPTAGVQLVDGSDYHLVIPAGSFTDISGGGANEEITLTYHGSYVREIKPSDKYLFTEDCTDYSQIMLYDGDRRSPDPVPASWGFTQDLPWLIVRDESNQDMAFASHSMYTPAGKSDDWLVTAQLFIPDENCYLEFDAQSYLFDLDDYLDVYLYSSDNIYNTLTADVINDIRNNGELVFHEKLSPGVSEENLADDWTTYTVDLKDYAQKPLYIAFVNQNDDQSAIFIDNIHVVHEMDYYTTFETPTRVVDQDAVTVKGYILFSSEFETYSSVELVLTDKEGTEIDRISESGLALTKGSAYDFSFAKPFPLTKGETSQYRVEVSLDGGPKSVLTGQVSNLTFQPSRRILLEEYTGSECGNCPFGIRGLENIESLYPNVMIPVTIRTYENDRLGSNQGAYSQYLGLDGLGAPSAIIDRIEAAYPMIQSPAGDYRFTGLGILNELTGEDERLWLDIFRSRYEVPAEIGVELKSEQTGDNVHVKVQVTNALNQYRATYNVFAVVVENGLMTYQKNYLSNVSDPNLGEWGAGGKYGTPLVTNVEAHSVARATWGTTYNGTAGLFPAQMKADETFEAAFDITLPDVIQNPDNCEVAVVILDSGTARVINANIVSLNGETNGFNGVEAITEGVSPLTGVAVIDGKIIVNATGKYSVAAYDIAGSAILSAKGEGMGEFPLNGYQGVVIVKVTDADGNSKSAKFMAN
ncbi:MAG: Omp28-related outer membrane protein [Muribaculaceae bacterium]|nr:Omp28-related outer membrane protein [Muribaculaceae bacterium]